MGNIIITAVLILIVIFAVYSTVRRIRFGSSCCGEKTPPDKKVMLLSKHEETERDLSEVVSSAGYVMLSCQSDWTR